MKLVAWASLALVMGCGSEPLPRVHVRSQKIEPGPAGPTREPIELGPDFAGYRMTGLVVRKVTVDERSVCALTVEGDMWCWGEDDAPRVMRLGGDIRDISGRCALSDRVRCDDDESAGRERRVREAVVLSEDRSGCAVVRDGRVACWYPPAPWDDASTHPYVPGVADALEVAVGSFGACALARSGRIVCWGAASLISWAPSGREHSVYPAATLATPLLGMSDVVHVSVDGGMPCVVRRSGRVHCWFPEDSPTLLRPNPLPETSEVQDLDDAVSVSWDLALRRDHTLVSIAIDWADNLFHTSQFSTGVLTGVTDVAGGTWRGCAVSAGGRLTCWHRR